MTDVPAFLRDAFDSEPELRTELARALDALPALLEPSEVAAGSVRLSAAVSAPPLRYAPFFDRLGALWALPEKDVIAAVSRAADPAAWRKPGLPGLRLIDVSGGPERKGAAMHLVRFSPGMRYPAHRHLGPEALFVLEGSYRDASGRVVGPGDLQEMAPDTEHHFVVGKHVPCIAASVHFGFEFTGTLMKVLVRLFG